MFDFECPECGKEWNHTGDPMGQDDQEEVDCPGCDTPLVITASWRVSYDVAVAPVKEPAK